MTRARKLRKKKRPPLAIAGKPTLIVADGDGVEALAMRAALAIGWPVLGYVPRGRGASASRPGTQSDHPLQAVKWNSRAADLTIVITADATLHGRALGSALGRALSQALLALVARRGRRFAFARMADHLSLAQRAHHRRR